MRSLLRGLAGAVLILGLAALGAGPGGLAAQDKKDVKGKDPKDAKTVVPAKPKDDPVMKDAGDRRGGISTSDGLSLNAYWYQGTAADKNPPDAVLMFPAPGSKVTDSWIALAKALSEKNFSVLLMDWRGCGMNAPDTAGSRVLADKELFWKEPFNDKALSSSRRTIEDKGLDWNRLKGASGNIYIYKNFLFNDLMAARFYLDRQNDNKKCNSARIWIVTEKDGGPVAMAFIASEFARNSIYNPKPNAGDTVNQFKSAGKDFVGLTCLSYSGGGVLGSTANTIFANSISQLAANGVAAKDAMDHLEHRLAMIMVYGKKERDDGSRSAFQKAGLGSGGTEEALKRNYKYLREIDNSKAAVAVTGIGLIDPMDSYKIKDMLVEAMVGVSKAQPTGKDPYDREANKMTIIPRFRAEQLSSRR